MDNTDWIDRNEYPFAPHYFGTPAGRMHYVDEGSGEVVVMLHGNPAWSFLYRKLIKKLTPLPNPHPQAGEGVSYRCIAPDYLGFGLSDKPYDWSYLPKEQAKNVEALIAHLGLKDITLVVNDWGGPIGMGSKRGVKGTGVEFVPGSKRYRSRICSHPIACPPLQL